MEKELIKATKIFKFFSSVPSSFRMELVPVQFLKKGTSSRNFRSLNEFLTQTARKHLEVQKFRFLPPKLPKIQFFKF